MIKVVVFDFDGLMFDTEKIWKKNFYKFNKIYNLHLTEEDRRKMVGKDENYTRIQLKKDYPNLDVDKYRDEINAEQDKCLLAKKVKAKKGLFKLLNYLLKNNYKIAILSGSPRFRLERVTKFHNLNLNIFNLVITAETYSANIRPKPFPDAFLYCAKKLNVKPSECIMLEDGYNGIFGAEKAGFKSIFIPDTLPVTNEISTKATVLKNLTQVIGYLKNEG